MGDFNSVLAASEISDPTKFSQNRSTAFAEWIFDQGLIDVGFERPWMTWKRGNQETTFKSARLDRALGEGDWIMKFQNAKLRHLPMMHSDHSPLLLNTDGNQSIKRHYNFKFQAVWLVNNDLEQVVRDVWAPKNTFNDNIKNLIPSLEEWNSSVFGNIRRKKDRLLARIAGIQRKLMTEKHNGLLNLEKRLQNDLEDILFQEELHWFQKSREEWIRSGDRNTRFYHMATTMKKSKNRVTGLLNDEGVMVTEENEMKEMIMNYFKSLFCRDESCDTSLAHRNCFPLLNTNTREEAFKEITSEDIHKALKEMAPLKAPGPDGLHAAFYKNMWHVVGESVISMAKGFFSSGVIPEGLNITNIALIPKLANPERPMHFRPIGLCNVSYKIISKAMTNRLKEVMKELVGPFQSSFVPNRQITDNIIVYQEVLNNMRRKRNGKGLMVVKIDLEKAYDRLSWDFIKDTLKEVGMDSIWIRNIMTCVETPLLSILWEGEQTDFFKPGRGIRQGDPISPYLFVLCIERLSHIILKEVDKGNWKGIKVSRNGPTLSHLFFADDMVLFREASEGQIDIVKDCLDRFCSCSGQKVSLAKSQIYVSNNVRNDFSEHLAAKAGIPLSKDLGRYLGVPSLHNRVNESTFAGILDRIKARLEGWKARYLSLAGRQVLAQSVLNSIPYYTMQTARLPLGLCDNIDKRIRQFIWGGTTKERSCNLVNWSTVTQPKKNGGLGIRCTRDMNKAFMTKLGWRLLNEENSLWAKVLTDKYMGGVKNIDCIRPKSGASNA